jgi:hypothetical protein
MKKCAPGVICIENVTLFFIIVIICILGFYLYMSSQNTNKMPKDRIIINQQNLGPKPTTGFLPSWPYTNDYGYGPQDVLLNPLAPPLKDERYFVPINVSTNIGATPTNTEYRQMGILTPLNGTNKDNILPLMGRPLFTNRNKWQYYTISNQHNNVKLPISFKGRSALSDYGVDQIFARDTVYVEGYNEPFKVTMYENDTIKYLPYL